MDEQFLSAIRAAPGDDLARLVYADYLEERGDAERAEFIRVQVESATLDEADPALAPLEDRAHELLARYESAWLTPEELAGLVEWEFRRGFLDQADLGSAAAAGGLLARHAVTRLGTDVVAMLDAPPAAFGSVRELDLRGGWEVGSVEPGGGDRYGALRLTGLILHDQPRWEAVAGFVSSLAARARLESVSCTPYTPYDPNPPFSPVPTRLLTALGPARLKQLSLAGADLGSADLAALLAPPTLGSLAELDIAHNPLGPDAWRAVRDADRELRLTRLDVSGTPLAGVSLEPLLSTRAIRDTLTDLDINGTGSARLNLEVLAGSGFWSRAESLRLHSATVPAVAFEPLARAAGPPGLRLLDLGDNYLRTGGVRLLAESAWAGSLTWLALSHNFLDDDALRILAESEVFAKLRTLHLAYNRVSTQQEFTQVTDAGALALARSPVLSRMRFLTLSHTAVTDVAAAQLLDGPHWKLAGLGLGGLGLTPRAAGEIARSPRLARLEWLDLSANPELGDDALMPLAESPHLTGLLELDLGGIAVSARVADALRARLGNRLSL